MNLLIRSVISCLCLLLGSFSLASKTEPFPWSLVDPQATKETRNLFKNLMHLKGDHTLFGHQNTNLYGVEWENDDRRSDVADVTGSFPAVYGYDFWHIEVESTGVEPVDYRFEDFVKWTHWAISKGAIVSFSWHQYNPVSQKSFFYRNPAVATILPGGSNHEAYRTKLDTLAAFFHEIAPYPVVFRPYHEHNGDWFWWGKGHCTEEEYIGLWQFTVEYLRDVQGVRNVLYAFSPDRSRMDLDRMEESYFYGYPGDEYVDIFGLDNYWDVGHPGNERPLSENQNNFIKSLEGLVDLANQHGKLPALTETGIEAQSDPTWWTQRVLRVLHTNEKTRQILWVLVWRNANREAEEREHFYAPYPSHPAAEDFMKFRLDHQILFEGDFEGIYTSEQLKVGLGE